MWGIRYVVGERGPWDRTEQRAEMLAREDTDEQVVKEQKRRKQRSQVRKHPGNSMQRLGVWAGMGEAESLTELLLFLPWKAGQVTTLLTLHVLI